MEKISKFHQDLLYEVKSENENRFHLRESNSSFVLINHVCKRISIDII